jgi:hypothetical protein
MKEVTYVTFRHCFYHQMQNLCSDGAHEQEVR